MPSLQTTLIYFSIGLFSLCIGSFLNVVIYRVPLMLERRWQQQARTMLNLPLFSTTRFDLCLPRSHCPQCQHTLSWHDNIPLISYLLLRGRCRCCLQKISIRYWLVEFFTTVLAISLCLIYEINLYSGAIFLFSISLLSLSLIDLKHQLLPDIITLPLLWLGLLININYVFASSADAIIGAIVGYLSLWMIAELYALVRKRQGLGLGDAKLLAALGAWHGWQALPEILLGAALLGLIVGLIQIMLKKHAFNKPFPFGPYLAIAGWISLLGRPYFTSLL